MDQNTAYQLFVATYHPDPNVHKQAELNIRNVSYICGVTWQDLYVEADLFAL